MIDLGSAYIKDPLGIHVNGKLSDVDGLDPLFLGSENDSAARSPWGTDLTALYAAADASNLYLPVRTRRDEPNEQARFTVEFRTD